MTANTMRRTPGEIRRVGAVLLRACASTRCRVKGGRAHPQAPATPPHAEVAARAGGRRRYNSVRQFNSTLRRAQVIELAKEHGLGRGARAQIARELGVHRSTITRDLDAVLYGRD